MNEDYKVYIMPSLQNTAPKIPPTEQSFVEEIKTIIQQGRALAYRVINTAMLETYWNLGKRIVEQEQQGRERANYGTFLIKSLSEILTQEFGKGYGERSLWDFRKFYLTFQENGILHTACAEFQISQNKQVGQNSATEDELRRKIERQKEIYRLQNENTEKE